VRGARSLRFRPQGFDPPFPSAGQSAKVDLASWTSAWQSQKVDLREPEGNGDAELDQSTGQIIYVDGQSLCRWSGHGITHRHFRIQSHDGYDIANRKHDI